MLAVLLIVVTLFLAYANGSNDNFKGVATLFGSGLTNYRKAIVWATLTTFLGSIASLFIATKLVTLFSHLGTASATSDAAAVLLVIIATGTATTVLIATLSGFPVSTTHALIGALTGTQFVWSGTGVDVGLLWTKFFLPLLVSPVVAVAGSLLLYPFLHFVRERLKISKEVCLCVGSEIESPQFIGAGTLVVLNRTQLNVSVGTTPECEERYHGSVLGVTVHQALSFMHFVSAGAVSFARGLNDTPKMVALLVMIQFSTLPVNTLLLGIVIALGGLLNARKVAETMSRRITTMNHGQGLTANIVTSLSVILASIYALPVSTTHVSVGSLFGLGLVTRKINVKMLSSILFVWVLTLPLAFLISAGFVYMFRVFH